MRKQSSAEEQTYRLTLRDCLETQRKSSAEQHRALIQWKSGKSLTARMRLEVVESLCKWPKQQCETIPRYIEQIREIISVASALQSWWKFLSLPDVSSAAERWSVSLWQCTLFCAGGKALAFWKGSCKYWTQRKCCYPSAPCIAPGPQSQWGFKHIPDAYLLSP